MADKLNFRQVGREVSGRVYKGTVTDAYHRTSSASIPSKYELVLSSQGDAKEGFGSAAGRFDKANSRNPGPGCYEHAMPKTSPSSSKRGYGGLISKSSRFKRYQYASDVPGPGSYVQARLEQIAKPSHMFIVNARETDFLRTRAPAVGHYDPKSVDSAKAVTSAFQSNSKRFSTEAKSTVPAPGQYTPSLTMTRANSAAHSSVFKPPSNVKRHQVNLYDPHTRVEENIVPGPGEYDLPSAFKSIDSRVSVAKTADTSRFGDTLRPKKANTDVPGPGHYELIRPEERVPVSGAVFMSESERFEFKTISKPPGPAYYKPTMVPRLKSFHLNANTQWV